MLHTNGQGVVINGHSISTTGDVRKTSKAKRSISRTQAEFLSFIKDNDAKRLSDSLNFVHDLALYHSDLPLDEEEKFALYSVKILWQELDELATKQ